MLQPDVYFSEVDSNPPTYRSIEKITLETYNPKKDHKRVATCKDCYCRDKPVSPRLGGFSFHCSKKDNKIVETRCKLHEELPTLTLDRQKAFCNHELLHKVKSSVDYEPKSQFLKNLQESSKSLCHCVPNKPPFEPSALEYTDRRARYEENRPLSCYEKSYSGKPDFVPRNASGERDQSATTEPKLNLHELNDFREKNYFDCVSTSHLVKEVPEHQCVHRFTVSDRLYPMPLNCDEYGLSRCVVCNEPMASEKAMFDLNVRDGKRVLKRYQYNLSPRRPYVGTGQELIKIKVPSNSLIEFSVPKFKCQPANSYALRFQKGVLR